MEFVPRPSPSQMPAAIAITFLSAPPVSTPATSECVYTLKLGVVKRSWTNFADSSLKDAATAAADYVASHLPATAEVAAQAAVTSYATAYWWGAGFFAVGGIIAALLFRRMGHGLSLANAHLAEEALEPADVPVQ